VLPAGVQRSFTLELSDRGRYADREGLGSRERTRILQEFDATRLVERTLAEIEAIA
jgi:hypothetical protein